MNSQVDQLAEEMTQICQKRIQAHEDNPVLSNYMQTVWEKAPGKVLLLPWNDLRKYSTVAVTTFVVISALNGDPRIEGVDALLVEILMGMSEAEKFIQVIEQVPLLDLWPECKAELKNALRKASPSDLSWPLLGIEAAGGKSEEAIPVSAAWNALHVGVVILDDVIDREILPPGSTYEARAALSSGPIFAAMQFVRLLNDPISESRVSIELFKDFFHCAYGQYLDATQERANMPPNDALQHYWKATILKSGSVYKAGVAAGAAFATADPATISALGAFGQAYGVIKQIYDDCQDVWVDLTKTKQELTLPVLLYRIARKKAEVPTDREQLVQRFREAHVPETIGEVLEEWKRRAFRSIADLDDSPALEELKRQMEDMLLPEMTRI